MTVLIIADDPEFARDVIGHWRMERLLPDFTVVSSTVWQDSTGEFDLAIVAPMPLAKLLPAASKLGASPALCVVDDATILHELRTRYPRLLLLRQHEGWLDALVLAAHEALGRVDALRRARRAEEVAAAAERYATLGRYMLEMRHTLNNSLTTVLGHAELLLLEPGGCPAGMRDQLATIHSMAMRMHEILQRFSSLDTEMLCVERQSHSETRARAQTSGGKA